MLTFFSKTEPNLSVLERAAIWTVVLKQALAVMMALVPTASYLNMIHKNTIKHMVSLQATMVADLIWYKLKFDDLYKRLTSGPKICITIGPSIDVTYRNIFEVPSCMC